MALSTANGPKSWSNLGPVTTVTVSVTHFRHGHLTKSLWPIHKQFSLKCRYPLQMGQKMLAQSSCSGADLTKEPPRGPFVHELRNQTGGNYIIMYTGTSQYITVRNNHECHPNQKRPPSKDNARNPSLVQSRLVTGLSRAKSGAMLPVL